jgi:hypothetical protein
LNTEIKFRERDKAFIENEIAKFSRRIESTPQVEQEVSDILRVRDDQKKVYDNLKGKLSEARLSESLESKQKGSQFEIVDPANYPIVPAKPNKQSVLMAGLVVSLLIALALAIAVDIARQKVWSQSQAETFWGAPVLIEIPEIVTDTDLAAAGKKKRTFAAFSAAGVLVYAVFLYGIYLKHNFFLQQLDPMIQKLIYK